MKILGKSVSTDFQSFYEEMVARIGIPKFRRSPTPGRGDCRLEGGVAVVRLRTDLSGPSFERHIVHELLHALQLVEGWPRIKSRLPDEPPILELGAMLTSVVCDLNVEDRSKQLPFHSTQNIDEQYHNLKKAILAEDIPPSGSLRWRKAAMMYAYASLTQPPKRWNELKELFSKRAPHIARKGEELIAIVKEHGWSNPDQALASMVAIRDSLTLPTDQVIIVDGRTEKRF